MSLRRLVETAAGDSDKDLPRLARIALDRLGDRFSFGLDADGVIVHGAVRRRHVPWDRVRAVHTTSRHSMLRSGAIERMTDDVLRAFGPLPIPGLRTAVRMLTERLTTWADRKFDAGLLNVADEGYLGHTLDRIECRGRDLTVRSALIPVALFADGTLEAIEAEAVLRGIPVRRS